MDGVKCAFFQQINGPSSLFGSENYMGLAGQARNDFSNVFSSATANIPVSSALAGRNPLEGTHELRQACQLCFVKKGKGLFGLDWVLVLFFLFLIKKHTFKIVVLIS